MPQPTLRDVAKAAGVHAATASRALNPATRGLVNVDTARRVINVAESLGYRANPMARGLKTAKSRTVGIVIPDLTNPLFPPIVRGIERVLEPAGYSVLIVSTDNDPERERHQIESLRSRQVEGLIVATALLGHPLLEQLVDEQLNMVLVNRRAENLGVSSVAPDDAAGVRMAVEHLAELGHRRIVHLAGPQTTSTGLLRAAAFRSTVTELGLDADPGLVVTCPYWTEADGAQALRELLDAGTGFTAIVAGNDLIALGCYDVFAERGLRCPTDLSVVGFNDMPFVDKVQPPLTTVAIPQYNIGVEAGRMLLEGLEEPGRQARSVLLPVSMTIRRSTAPARPTPRRQRQVRVSPPLD